MLDFCLSSTMMGRPNSPQTKGRYAVLDTKEAVQEPSEAPQKTAQIDLRRELNLYHDRCDRCGAQAFVIATKDESELLFCGHHGSANMAALIAAGWGVQDETDKINEKPSVSANAAYEEEEQ